jgi:hypothetical protein
LYVITNTGQIKFIRVCDKNDSLSQEWWYTPVIPVLRRLRQENYEFHSSMGYIVRPYLNKKNKTKR